MKILHVIIGLGTGGAEHSLARLVLAHKDHLRYEHEVVSLTELGAIGKRLRKQGVSASALSLKGGWSALAVFLRLRRLIRKTRPDIVQCWMYHADLIGGLCARSAGVENVIWGVRNSYLDGNGLAKRVLRRVCAILSPFIPHAIVCVAESARLVHEQAGYCSERMLVIPNGYDVASFQSSPSVRSRARREFGFVDGDVVIGSIGRFTPAKDHLGFLQEAEKVLRAHPRVKLLMLGRGVDSVNKSLASMIASGALNGRVVLAGERSDVPACLAAMDIFCLHSRTEGFPNALGEAMAAALPCVATDVGDASAMLGDAGVVVPSVEHISAGLFRVLALEIGDRAQIGDAARARIQSEFTTQHTTRKFEDLYNDLVDGG